MPRIAFWTCEALVVLLLCANSADARLPIEAFAAKPWMGSPVVSPNGRFIAVPLSSPGGDVVGVYEADAMPSGKVKGLKLVSSARVDWVRWVNDDRLLVAMKTRSALRKSGKLYDTSVSFVVAVNRDGTRLTELFANRQRFPRNFDLSEIVDILPDDPRAVLMDARDAAGRDNLYRVDVYTGKVDEVARGSYGTYWWLTDANGIPRARWDRRRGGDIEVHLRQGDGDDWQEVARYSEQDFPLLDFVGIADDPKTAIVASRQSSDKFGLFEFDIATGTLGRPLYQHASVDVGKPVGGPLYDPVTGRLIGAYFVEDAARRHYFDPALAALHRKIESRFPDAVAVRAPSWSRDRNRIVVQTSGPKDPASYFLYDATNGTTTSIGQAHRDLPANELGEMRAVSYIARDGTRIPAYLTFPPDTGSKGLPMVVLPHGGPETRDYIRYDAWVQMIANRGYVVFQPNFRGSGGYGKAYAERGYRQWGRLMQDDVTDGVRALIADGTADASRICIVGASYGGYAALAGGAFTPELYKCVISIAGLSDLVSFMESRSDQLDDDSDLYRYWLKLLGDPRKEMESMRAVSPAFHAAEFRAPVLLIHGDTDENVPPDQSSQMAKSLRRADKDVQLIIIEREGHDFSYGFSNLKVLTELERFLERHLGRKP